MGQWPSRRRYRGSRLWAGPKSRVGASGGRGSDPGRARGRSPLGGLEPGTKGSAAADARSAGGSTERGRSGNAIGGGGPPPDAEGSREGPGWRTARAEGAAARTPCSEAAEGARESEPAAAELGGTAFAASGCTIGRRATDPVRSTCISGTMGLRGSERDTER